MISVSIVCRVSVRTVEVVDRYAGGFKEGGLEMGDVEEHVCQSCGTPVNPDDYAGGSEKGDYCSFCIVHPEKSDVRAKVAEDIMEETGKQREEAEKAAEEKMSRLKRWQ